MVPGVNGYANELESVQLSAVGTLWDTGDSGADEMQSGLFQLIGTFVATTVVEGSNNGGTTWTTILSTRVDSTSINYATTASSANAFAFNTHGYRRIRGRVSAYTSGAVKAAVTLSPFPVTRELIQAAQQGTWTLAAATALIGDVTPAPRNTSANALTNHRRAAAAASVNNTLVATGARKLFGGSLHNASAGTKFLKLYNKAIAPVAGTDTPVMTIAVPAGQTLDLWKFLTDFGKYFSLGLGYAITGAAGDADTTALAANDIISLCLDYL